MPLRLNTSVAPPHSLQPNRLLRNRLLHNPRLAFKSEERFELENLIRRCNHQPFDKATAPPGARALISGLLVASPTARLTALQVLAHPWVAGLGASAAPPLPPQPPAR